MSGRCTARNQLSCATTVGAFVYVPPVTDSLALNLIGSYSSGGSSKTSHATCMHASLAN